MAPILVSHRKDLKEDWQVEYGLHASTPDEITHIQDFIARSDVSLEGLAGYAERLGEFRCFKQTRAPSESELRGVEFIFDEDV